MRPMSSGIPGQSVDAPPVRGGALPFWSPPVTDLILPRAFATTFPPPPPVKSPPGFVFPFPMWTDDGLRRNELIWGVAPYVSPPRQIQPGPPIPPPPLTAAYAIIQLSFGYSARVQPAAPPFISTITSGDTVSWLVFFYAVTGRLINPAVATLSIVYSAARGQFSFTIPLVSSPLNGWSASWTALPSFGGGVATWTISVPNSAMPPQSGVVYVTNFRRI
jgi:hypothetical protein